jgi:hypothetical protein
LQIALFDRVPRIARAQRIVSVFRESSCLCLKWSGADWVPYLAGAADRGGTTMLVSPATDAPLRQGDGWMLATGLVWDGFCDLHRTSIGTPKRAFTQSAHAQLIGRLNWRNGGP